MQVKQLKDYYESIQQKYPDVPLSDIKKILNYGWKIYYLYNTQGGDVIVKNKSFWSYTGFLTKNTLKHFISYTRKLATKIRILNQRNKTPWSGYYYFALTDKQYEDYLKQKKSKGRPRKKFNYGNQILFKLLEECRVIRFNRKYIFRVPYIAAIGSRLYRPNFISDKAELIETRETINISDILTSNYKYQYI